MKALKPKSWNMGVAVVAAYMLMLQGLLGAFALGAANALPMMDVFGNPLCITSAEASASLPDERPHTGVPECCTVACSMFSALGAGDRTSSSLANPLSTPAAALFQPATVIIAPFTLERGPGSPRAPPSSL